MAIFKIKLFYILQKKKNQLNNKESKIKRREFKIKTVLSEFDRIMKEDKMWKKVIKNKNKIKTYFNN